MEILRGFHLRPASALMMTFGIAIGLIGGRFLAIHWHANRVPLPHALEEIRLQANAAHGNDSLVIASGPVDGAVDGLFCLDSTTGKLTGFVLHPRAHKFDAVFQANVLEALPIEQGKKPAYAMTVGRMKSVASFKDSTLGDSVIYVADCNTGRIAAYGFPGNTIGGPHDGSAVPFLRLDGVRSREVNLREQK